MCDYITCNLITAEDPITVDRTMHQYIGDRKHPFENGEQILRAYQTVPLSGSVKLEVPYYTDSGCQQQQLFTTVLDVP